MKTNEFNKHQENESTIKGFFSKPSFTKQLQTVLPTYLTPDRMIRIALTELRMIPKLLECDPISFMGAIIRCAQMGLEPSSEKGHVYLLPFYNGKTKKMEVKVLVGYKGMIYQAGKSNIYIEASEVCLNDDFEIEQGLEPKLRHKPCIKGDSGEIIGFYAIARIPEMPNLPPLFRYMTKEKVDKIMMRAVENKSSSPWHTDYEEMGKKTLIRNIFKRLPLKDERLEQIIRTDESAEEGTQNNASILEDLNTAIEPNISESKTDNLLKTLQANQDEIKELN